MPSAGAWPGQSNTVTADPTRNSTPAMLPIHAVKARVGLTVRVREVSGRGRATAAMIAAVHVRQVPPQSVELVVGDGFREMHQHRGRIGTGVEDFAQRLRGGLRARLHRGVQVRA